MSKELIKVLGIVPTHDKIAIVEDNTSHGTNRALVKFTNGLRLSIVSGFGAYSREKGTFEIAIMNNKGEFTPELFDDDDKNGEDVCGWCSTEKVKHYIQKISNIVK